MKYYFELVVNDFSIFEKEGNPIYYGKKCRNLLMRDSYKIYSGSNNTVEAIAKEKAWLFWSDYEVIIEKYKILGHLRFPKGTILLDFPNEKFLFKRKLGSFFLNEVQMGQSEVWEHSLNHYLSRVEITDFNYLLYFVIILIANIDLVVM